MTPEQIEERIAFLEKGNAFAAMCVAKLTVRLLSIESALLDQNIDIGGLPVEMTDDIDRLVKDVGKAYGIRS